MARGDQAILKYDTGPLDGGVVVRWWRHLADPSASFVTKCVRKLASDRKTARVWGLGALAAVVLIAGVILMRRSSGTTSSDSSMPIPIPRKNSAKASHGTAGAKESSSARTFTSDYKILMVRSIFAMDGASSAARPAAPSAPAAPDLAQGLSAAGNLTLKGILGEDGRVSAFVEDAARKQMFEVHVGDPLGPGRVRELSSSELVYEVEGKTMRIRVGQGLDGSLPVSVDPPVVQVAEKRSGHKKRGGSGE